jgi:Protein of unknown function (DUF2380)
VRYWLAGAALLCLALAEAFAGDTSKTDPVKIAVFAFELEDKSPEAALLNKSADSSASLQAATNAARVELNDSRGYSVIDASNVEAAHGRALRDCDGCEAGIALQLGAQQSLLGVVTRATQTDYYVAIVIRDARSGKVLDLQGANFAGTAQGWPSGVRMLIRHQILASPN